MPRHGVGPRLLLPAVALAACSEPDWTRVVGTLNSGTERTIIATAPAQVEAGEWFTLTVSTVGSSNCTRADGNDLTVSGSLARFVPYDEVPSDARPCFRDEAPFPHTDALSFQEPGTARIRIVGQFGQIDGAVVDSVDLDLQVVPAE
jgi:hypothetical protein